MDRLYPARIRPVMGAMRARRPGQQIALLLCVLLGLVGLLVAPVAITKRHARRLNVRPRQRTTRGCHHLVGAARSEMHGSRLCEGAVVRLDRLEDRN